MAQLYYASPHQINFVVPDAAAPGYGTVTITSDIGSFAVPVEIATSAPGIFTLGGSMLPAAYLVRFSNGVQTIESVFDFQDGCFIPRQIHVGNDDVYLILFGTGIRSAPITFNNGSPVAVYTSAAAGGPPSVTFVGPQPGTPGLDQVNIQLPKGLVGSGPDGYVEIDFDTAAGGTVLAILAK
jgi:uncharacterized protein (TIGR03437 family)